MTNEGRNLQRTCISVRNYEKKTFVQWFSKMFNNIKQIQNHVENNLLTDIHSLLNEIKHIFDFFYRFKLMLKRID